MKLFRLAAAVLLSALAPAVVAGDVDTSHHKAVYRQINDMQDSLQKTTASVDGEGGRIALTGWMDGESLVKIVAKPGNTGTGADEIYLEGGQPLFVFSTSVNSESGKRIEERIYLQEGRIMEWLSTDKTFVPHGEDYESFARQLGDRCATFVSALTAKSDKGTAKVTTGVFLGIEEGDYFHWKMRTQDGEEASFFLLKPNAALQRVLDDPQEYEGRKCRVRWKTTVESLPEAGGQTSVDQIIGVEWL